MTDHRFDITRRKALAALGTIGVASAGAGLGTSAYFSDQETFENNRLTAGTLDMKVAATEYYSDWSSDEAELAGMAADDASTDFRLPPGEGQSGAQAIAIDLADEYTGDAEDVYAAFFDAISTDENGTPYNRVNGGIDAALDDGLCGDLDPIPDADGAVVVDVDDVKPGDFGGAQFAFELCDNPGYVWLNGSLRDASENGVTEPEADDPDEADGEGEAPEDVVELLDEIQVAYSVGAINDDPSGFEDTSAGFQPVDQYTLREFLDLLGSENGIPLEGDVPAEEGGGSGRNCFAGSPEEGSAVHQVSVVWWLPIDHGNEVQSDSVTFDLGFYTEQCRHNDGGGMPSLEGTTGSGDFPETSYQKALGTQMLGRGGSGRGEIQVHSDSGGVEDQNVFGNATMPTDTDIPFTVELDPDAETVSITVNDVTVTDTDVTDGTANGASTGDAEFPGGVPSEVDVAINAYSGSTDVTTVVSDVTISGGGVTPDTISSQSGNSYLEVTDVSASGPVTVEGTIRFEGSAADYTTQDWVGVDFR